MPNLGTINTVFNEKSAYILGGLDQFESKVKTLQEKLLDLVMAQYAPMFDVNQGQIMANAKNYTLLMEIDSVFDKFARNFQDDVLRDFSNSLLKITNLNANYYEALGFRQNVINDIARNKMDIQARLGITPTGRLQANGYLARLGQTQEVRLQMKDYVVNSITTNTGYSDFIKGFEGIIEGNNGVNGALVKYYDQYAYDKFNEVDAATGAQYAKNLGLNHAIYEGSVIKTTRPFCRKKAGKAFTKQQILKWKNDPDLIDKKTKDAYKPLIDRGRYRCRHFYKWITEELYKEFIKNQ